MTLSKLKGKLQDSKTPQSVQAPSASKLREILRNDFQLRYRTANAAKIKYNDVSYDDKRVWMSRLLAQFLLSGVIIVSIDESSFKQEGLAGQYW